MRTIFMIVLTLILLPGTLFAAQSAMPTAKELLNSVAGHCPQHSTFWGVQVSPVKYGQHVIQCLAQNGTTYHAEQANVSLIYGDDSWLKQEYPEMWLCFGTYVEDCKFLLGKQTLSGS